jgi:c-di-AMP phosphodiesterase-like protein
MECLGGGGHQTMAAAQLENVSIAEARKQLIKAIDDNHKE